MVAKLDRDQQVLAAAGGFTGLWAVTWLGTTVMAAGSVSQGAFGVGSVMAGSGLTALWWKTRAMKQYTDMNEEQETAVTPPS
ncbi:MAG TPA: hypothetical protein VM370_01975 [Candidatus Thermoplasmatota archaeon]|nr:hypothetical protein [Candidatus Thermoplasmatota archaeon]